MSGVVHSTFSLTVPHGKLPECIRSLEEGLRSIKEARTTRPLVAIFSTTSKEKKGVRIRFQRNNIAELRYDPSDLNKKQRERLRRNERRLVRRSC